MSKILLLGRKPSPCALMRLIMKVPFRNILVMKTNRFDK